MKPKPRIAKEGDWWMVWFPIFATTGIKNSFSTWGEAMEAAGIWHWATTAKINLGTAQNRRTVTTATNEATNYINHISFVIDESGSMGDFRHDVVKVVDNQVAYLARRSEEMGQETRVTIYTFSDTPRCRVSDTDVLRAPSIKDTYRPNGGTALIDATLLALEDATLISEKYGDHAHLIYVFTDGQENLSGWKDAKPGTATWNWRTPKELIDKLRNRLGSLPENVTVACMVPSAEDVFEAKRFGFHGGNVTTWDATSSKGVSDAGETMRRTTDSYMTARATGTRSTTNLFDIGANVVNAQAILDAGLKPLEYDDYSLVPVGVWPGQVKPADYDEKKRRKPWKAHGGRIDEFVKNVNNGQYQVGQAYYQLMEGTSVRVQASKKIAIVNKKTGRAYVGAEARKLLNLPNYEVRIKPTATDDYSVFVQSMAANRLLLPGSQLLILKK